MWCFNRVLPPAGQNPEKKCVSTGFCLRRLRILEHDVFFKCPLLFTRFHVVFTFAI